MTLRLFICPICGRIQPVSRKMYLTCPLCEDQKMEILRLSYESYTRMSKKERNDYIEGWMYIYYKGNPPERVLETQRKPSYR